WGNWCAAIQVKWCPSNSIDLSLPMANFVSLSNAVGSAILSWNPSQPALLLRPSIAAASPPTPMKCSKWRKLPACHVSHATSLRWGKLLACHVSLATSLRWGKLLACRLSEASNLQEEG